MRVWQNLIIPFITRKKVFFKLNEKSKKLKM
jgi:hypothetical protein